MATPTATLNFSSVGDAFLIFTASLTKGIMTKIKSAAVVYGDNGPKPKRQAIVDIPETETSEAIDNLSKLFNGIGIDVKVDNLVNGIKHYFFLEVIGQTNDGNFIRAVSNPSRAATPVGRPNPPVTLSSAATGKQSFNVRVARHTNDGGAQIKKVLAYYSLPINSNGETVNEIKSKEFDYTDMYTKNEDGYYPEWLDLEFTSNDEIVQDTLYELTFAYANDHYQSEDSDVTMVKPSNTPGPALSPNSVGSDRQATVKFTSPSNASFAPVLGVALLDQASANPLATRYYRFNSDGTLSSVASVTNFGTTGFLMKSNNATLYSFVVDRLINNADYSFKMVVYNINGEGDQSAAFIVRAQAPPSAVTDLRAFRYVDPNWGFTPYYSAKANAELDLNTSLIKSVAVEVTFSDPLENWPTHDNSNRVESYKVFAISHDATEAAEITAVKRFFGVNNTGASSVNAEKALDANEIIGRIRSVAAGTSLASWNGLNEAQKLSLCNTSVQLRAAMHEYYKVLSVAKLVFDSNVFVDNV
jgi:hypothetical protein